jgi:hypothetical protein
MKAELLISFPDQSQSFSFGVEWIEFLGIKKTSTES